MSEQDRKPVAFVSPWPSVCRTVLYYDREEIVNADQAKRVPEPFAAVVTRVHKDDQGEDTRVLTLGVFDPEIGFQVKRDVREGDYDELGRPVPEAHRWFWPPRHEAHAPAERKSNKLRWKGKPKEKTKKQLLKDDHLAALADDDSLVWGTRADDDSLVWGTKTQFLEVLAAAEDGDTFVWGTRSAEGDVLVWGN